MLPHESMIPGIDVLKNFMKFSCFTLCLPEYEPAEALHLIKEAGYDGIEWRCDVRPEPFPSMPSLWKANRATLDPRNWKIWVKDIRSMTLDSGLEFSSLASYCRADEPEALKVAIEISRELGCPRFRIVPPRIDRSLNYEKLLRNARQAYAKAAELCRDAALQGLIELHMGTLVPSASMAYRIVHDIDSMHLGVIYDPGNMIAEGYEHWTLGCELLGSHLAFCHAKNTRFRPIGVNDAGGLKWGYDICEMHTGFVDWVEVFRAFTRVRYDGWVSNESYYSAPGHAPELLRQELEYLKRCHAVAQIR